MGVKIISLASKPQNNFDVPGQFFSRVATESVFSGFGCNLTQVPKTEKIPLEEEHWIVSSHRGKTRRPIFLLANWHTKILACCNECHFSLDMPVFLKKKQGSKVTAFPFIRKALIAVLPEPVGTCCTVLKE